MSFDVSHEMKRGAGRVYFARPSSKIKGRIPCYTLVVPNRNLNDYHQRIHRVKVVFATLRLYVMHLQKMDVLAKKSSHPVWLVL